MTFTLTFLYLFAWSIYLVSPLLFMFGLLIVALSQVVARHENWNRFDALYWSLITATTVGYGDIRPLRPLSRILAIVIALIGIMLTGLILAVTLNTASIALDQNLDPEIINKMKAQVEAQETN